MIARTSTPDIEWFHLFDCCDCLTRAMLQGIVQRRSLNLLVIRLPLGRLWYFRCQACNVTRRVDQKTWRQWREHGITPQEAYLESRRSYALATEQAVIAVSD